MRSRRQRLDLSERIERIIEDLCARVPEFAHIRPGRLLICLARARSSTPGGVYAKIIPMRFPDGSLMKTVKGHRYALPQIPTAEGDVLYLIYLYVPRFFEQPFERRLLTLVHELYHIAPAFDGTIRRVGNGSHGASRAKFNEGLQPLLDRYLAASPPEELLDILHADLNTLAAQVILTGRVLRLPRAVKLAVGR